MFDPFLDVVNGVIVGEEGKAKRAKLFYDGRSQTQSWFHADTDSEIMDWAEGKKAELIEKCPHIYNQDLFEVRIWDN